MKDRKRPQISHFLFNAANFYAEFWNIISCVVFHRLQIAINTCLMVGISLKIGYKSDNFYKRLRLVHRFQ